jgi:hypothetical protein
MRRCLKFGTEFVLALLVGGLLAPNAPAASPSAKSAAGASAVQPAGSQAASRYLPDRFAGQAGRYYRLVWGVDTLSVKLAESGEIIRFSWRVVDADRAKPLNEKLSTPSLVDPQAGVSLVVPSMEQIGQLRQTSTPQDGKTYWMAFSNKGRLVKRGDRVDIVVGQFRASGLVVD